MWIKGVIGDHKHRIYIALCISGSVVTIDAICVDNSGMACHLQRCKTIENFQQNYKTVQSNPASLGEYHTYPKAKQVNLMLSVDKFPY